MCGMSRERVTIDADSLSSEIRDGSIRVIDVRKKDDYTRGHIPGSLNLPLADLLSDDGPERVQKIIGSLGIGDETPVAVYDDTFGALASRVAWAIKYVGHAEVSLLDVTYERWRSLGLENSTDAPDVAAKEHSLSLRPDMLSTAEYLESSKGREDVLLVDNRERLNYLDQHIPGAINIPYRTLGLEERIILSRDEMMRLLKNRGISPENEIITYCGSVGTLSGLAYYALKSVGMPNVRLYVRSFKEWKDLQKPVERQEHANYWDLSAE